MNQKAGVDGYESKSPILCQDAGCGRSQHIPQSILKSCPILTSPQKGSLRGEGKVKGGKENGKGR